MEGGDGAGREGYAAVGRLGRPWGLNSVSECSMLAPCVPYRYDKADCCALTVDSLLYVSFLPTLVHTGLALPFPPQPP